MDRLHCLAGLLLVALCSAGCSSQGSYVWARDAPAAILRPAERTIRPGDEVVVSVRDQPSMSAKAQVTEDGFIVVPVIGAVEVQGQTTKGVEAAILARLRGIVVSPEVRVVLAQAEVPAVGVLGEVRTPGYHELNSSSGLLDALAKAGGLTEFADHDAIFLLRRGDPPLRVRFTYADLVNGEVKSNAIKLRDGDIVVVE